MHILRFAALTAATLLAATSAMAQNYYSEDFDTDIAGWTITGGYENQWFSGATACGGVGGALQSNMYSGTTSCEITSPSISGMTAYGLVSKVLTYDYKCATWPSGNTTPAPNPWGSFDVQISSDGGVSWSTLETVSDEVQSTNCITRSRVFTTASGVTDVIVRFVGNWTAGDYYLNIDNVSIDVAIPCSGPPAPGDILVTGSICAPGDSVDLSLEFEVPGFNVSYEWFDGSFNPIGCCAPTITVAPASLPATYSCRVFCAGGFAWPEVTLYLTTSATFPQPFPSSELDDCWTEVASVNDVDGQPKFDDTRSANGDGLGGSVYFDFYRWQGSGDTCEWISPPFAPVAANTFVTFDVAGKQFGSAVDQVALEESNDGGLTWSTVAVMDNAPGGELNPLGLTGGNPAYLPADSEWATRAHMLSVGVDRIRFVATTDYGNNVYFDNIDVVVSAAGHVPYGTPCISGYVITADVPPTQGATVNYTVNSMPDFFQPPLGVQVGLFVLSFAEAPPVVPLSLVGGFGTCLISVNNLDYTVTIAQGPGAPNSAVIPFSIPVGIPNGVELHAQAVNITPTSLSNPAGLYSSQALKIITGW